ncbi:MAG: hypothetical protein K5984_02880 [Bacteroidales bacterium]|nr:hypothetical protein [Bacteroidales bacterium]
MNIKSDFPVRQTYVAPDLDFFETESGELCVIASGNGTPGGYDSGSDIDYGTF